MFDLSAEAIIALVGVLLSIPAVVVLFWTLRRKCFSAYRPGIVKLHCM